LATAPTHVYRTSQVWGLWRPRPGLTSPAKIVDATMDLFSEVGYAPQRCAGAAKGAPYHHFNSQKRSQLPSSTKAPNPTDDAFRHAHRARAEGNLREGFDPCAMRETIPNAMLGAHLLAATAHASDHIKRLTGALKLLLPAIVRHVIGLRRRISCPASPYATTKSPVRLTEHTSRTIARQPRAAPSSSQT
jgi:hypothetical protein